MKQLVRRRDFIRKFMRGGFTYMQSERAYDAMISCFEDAIVNGNKIRIGHVGSLTPTELPPREVYMGFRRIKGNKVIKDKRLITLGTRKQWKLEIFGSFLSRHKLYWFDSAETATVDR